ncbi:MAG: NAD-binding protein [Elainellaceae cyanobacterium]
MQRSFQRIVTGTIFFCLTILGAVVGYSLFGWPLSDAFYMVIITIFGVGYGEVQPLETSAERFFTVIVILAGFISVTYIVGGFVQMLMEGEINHALDARRKAQGLEQLSDHVIVCGFGRTGQVLARQLKQENKPFVILDQDVDRANRAEALGCLAHVGNATDEDTLQTVGIARAHTLATVLPDDAVNVFITLTARGLNPKLTIVARGELPATEKKLRLAGANHVVLPAAISAQRMANLIIRPTAIDFLEQNSERSQLDELLSQIDIQIDELAIPSDSQLMGSTLGELEIQGNRGILVVAVRGTSGSITMNPGPSYQIHGGDTLILMAHQGDIPQLARLYRLKQALRYRGARA